MKKFLKWTAIVIGVGFLILVVLVILIPVPDPNEEAIAETTTVMYADGQTQIGTFGDINRINIPLSEVPIDTQHAVLAAEDRNFYEHGAISIKGIARAFWNNITGGETQGGSTITQQYVKNMYLTQEQTLVRKFKEMLLSMKLEIVWSKDQILEGYLNTIYFGRGAYGIEAASQAYYNHPTQTQTTAEGVALAGIIQSPNNYQPDENPEGLQQRFDYVRGGMVEEGWLTEAESAALVMPEFPEQASNDRYGGQVGYILTEVKDELLAAGLPEAEIDGGGLQVVTTIDQQAQDSIVASVEQNGPSSGTEGLRIGIAAIQPGTGAILAMYGGPDYVTNQLNNATQARAQAGSTFKPYALAGAFESGISLDSMWDGNSPRTISGYTLENEGNTSYGTVSLLQATEKSINTPFVDLSDTIGVDKVVDSALRAGLPADTPGIEENLTFVLGTASPTPMEMAGTYATFATRGVFHEPTIIQQVLLDGSVQYAPETLGEQRFEPDIMDNVNYALERVVTNGTGSGAQAIGRPSAGKTGTTDDNLSAWYIGYTPQMVAAVMMAKEDEAGNPITLSGTGGLSDVYGGSFPLSMWVGFAEGYLDGKPVEDFADPTELPDYNNPPAPTPSPTESPTPSASPTPTPTPSESTPPEPTPSAEPTPTEPPPGPSSSPAPSVP